jgi:hypothetical protein
MQLLGLNHEVKKQGFVWISWEDNIKMDLEEVLIEGAWTGSVWLRIGTGGGLF